MPDLSLERECGGIVAGVDEVGRGPWAGPVVAAAVILPPDLPGELADGLDDSKKLKAARREFLCAALKDCAGIDIGIGAGKRPRDRTAQHPGRHLYRDAPGARCLGPDTTDRPDRRQPVAAGSPV